MAKGFIYFAVCDVLGVVKIGYSANPKNRLTGIQNGCPFPVRLAATIPGDRAEERLIQKTLAQYRLQREWFWLNDKVEAVLQAAKAQTEIETSTKK